MKHEAQTNLKKKSTLGQFIVLVLTCPDQTWIRRGLVAVPWVRFDGGSDDLSQKDAFLEVSGHFQIFFGP